MQGRAANWNIPVEKIPTRDEVCRVLEVAKRTRERDYLFFAVCANTSLRVSEVVHLKNADVMKGDQLCVIRRKKRMKLVTCIDIPHELAVLMSAAVTGMKGWLFPGDAGPCKVDRKKKGEVVSTDVLCQGGHVSRREMQRSWDECAKAAGVKMPGRGIHSLRHYAITAFYTAHRDPVAAQALAGHSSLDVTMKYAHAVEMKELIQKTKPTL